MMGDVTRRSVMAGGVALTASGLLPRVARATPISVIVDAPAGRFESDSRSENDAGAWAFRGIRYGRAERFMAPRPEPRAADIVEAREFGTICPQGKGGANQSEDCLFLNIWKPRDIRAAAKRPVMVYIHGGAYSNGTVTVPLNDGAKLAQTEDVVVVTVNHRLNAFGYLYLAGIDPRFADSGNCGQLDLILALQWVKRNIAAFGGDPNRVFVWGQSGGGAKIATMMGMPAAKGLFHSCATMSGQQVFASGANNATKRTDALLDKLGLKRSEAARLIDLPMEKLLEGLSAPDPILGGGLYMGPVVDMKWLTRHPFWPDANPQSNAIPMILGNTRDETKAFVDPNSDRVKTLNWDNLAERMVADIKVDLPMAWIVEQYRGRFPGITPQELFYKATTAGRSWQGQVIEADARAAAGAKATWVYQVDYQSPTQPERGAPHTMDIALTFGTLGAQGSYTGTGPAAQKLSGQMMAAFAALARTGKPVAKGVPAWPAYTLPKRTTMLWDVTSRAVNDPRKWERELFARGPYIQPGI